ncbi:MAG: hemolysin family protein [Candidatus Aminicenantes bacterium]|nr:hemolysin family protein [Candidatus Aminicenantes bacterium]MDH5385127.1 hemolysin family protein [Candidatus Aminicenantes bacterium]
MEVELEKWIGFGLSFLAMFLVSLFHISLALSSKISISRLLEDKDKKYRQRILDIYDELKIAIEFIRILFLIAFLVYIYMVFPRLRFWPLWLFLISLGIYVVTFDILPRLISLKYRDRIIASFLPSFRIPYIISKPLLLLSKAKTFAKEQEEEQREASEEEIQALIEEAKEEGIIEKEEGVLLKSVVEFGDTVAKEIMTPRVELICIRKDATIGRLRDLVIKEKHSRIPVYKDRVDNIEGVILAKDLLEYSDEVHKASSIEPLIRPVHFVPESMKVSELLKGLQNRREKLAIVVDEHGGVSGLVTMEDLMEEIVGEIQDEYDHEEVQFIEEGPFDYIVLGDAEVEELEDLFDIDFAQDEYITVSGLITHSLGRLPYKGEKLELKGLLLEILEVDQKRIKKLRITKAPM